MISPILDESFMTSLREISAEISPNEKYKKNILFTLKGFLICLLLIFYLGKINASKNDVSDLNHFLLCLFSWINTLKWFLSRTIFERISKIFLKT